MENEQTSREANKICGVCGDRALGYNFNAVSCESCKAFFRRNALKNKDFRCPFTENCTITPVTRRFCQKCRLDKCFSIGMRKECIMSEQAKVLKRQKIEQNRAKKRPQCNSAKIMKVKKGCVDNFEATTISVNTVASTITDTYFWESERKYADLDANRQSVTESLSPVTAASVPSPSSPPESSSIIGSKTLDMLKDSSHNSTSSFGKFEQSTSQFEANESDIERRISSDTSGQGQSRFNEFSLMSQSLEKVKNSIINAGKFDQTLLDFNSEFGAANSQSPKYSSEFEEHIHPYPKFEEGSVQSSSSYMDHVSSPNAEQIDLNSTMHTSLQVIQEETLCQKPKETCPKGSDLISKFMQNPALIIKFMSNPNLVSKIFQDQGIFLKLMTDPDTVNRLVADPQISQFLEENMSTEEREAKSDNKINVQLKEALENTDISDNVIKSMLKGKQSRIENPILRDLIGSKSLEECKNERVEPSTSGECNKSMADVTRDVLQDVQRYEENVTPRIKLILLWTRCRVPIAANSIESILCEAIKLEFSAYSALGSNQSRRELNDAERAKLNELIVANKALLAPLDEDITNLVGEDCKFKSTFTRSDPVLLDVINLTAIAIRRLIKMSKKINAFKNMCQEDQIALLKGGCTEMMILRSAINYDPEKDMWQIPHSRESMSNISADVLKEAKGNLYTEHARFIRNFDPRWRDENIILILSAIALFTPDRPRVVHSDVIKLEQNSYYYLLRRYLESVYPGCEAKSTFLKLIQKISELHRLNDEVVGVYLNVNPSSVEPLLIEIFDLKH